MSSRGTRLIRSIVAAGTALLAGCVGLPTGPMVAVQPGSTSPVDVFRGDDMACRQWTVDVLGGPYAMFGSAYESQWHYDHAYAQCMYARGHAVPSGMVPPTSGARPAPVR